MCIGLTAVNVATVPDTTEATGFPHYTLKPTGATAGAVEGIEPTLAKNLPCPVCPVWELLEIRGAAGEVATTTTITMATAGESMIGTVADKADAQNLNRLTASASPGFSS